jgi:hypothetical protein
LGRKAGEQQWKKAREKLESCLLKFVERVSEGNATTEAEVQVLLAVAQTLIDLSRG